MTRDDAETIFFALSGSCLAMFTTLAAGWPVERSLFLGSITVFAVPTYVYGSRVLGRTLPDHARAYNEWRLAIAPGPNLRTVPDVPFQASYADTITREQLWRAELRRFLLAGRYCHSFAIRDLAYDKTLPDGQVRHKFVTDTGCRTLSSVLKGNGILDSGHGGTDYAPDWNYGRAVRHVQAGTIFLPLKPDKPPRVSL